MGPELFGLEKDDSPQDFLTPSSGSLPCDSRIPSRQFGLCTKGLLVCRDLSGRLGVPARCFCPRGEGHSERVTCCDSPITSFCSVKLPDDSHRKADVILPRSCARRWLRENDAALGIEHRIPINGTNQEGRIVVHRPVS